MASASLPTCTICGKGLSCKSARYCSKHKGLHPNLVKIYENHIRTEETRRRISIGRTGKDLGDRPYRWHKGQEAWNKGLPNPNAKLLKHAFKKGFTPWNKGLKKGDHPGIRYGSSINTWKGGVTPEHFYLRKTLQYKEWRKSVFKRDQFTCVLCGHKGGEINADHIKPFSLFPELRFDVDNGRTLCVPCHKKTDTWGAKSRI